MPGQASGQHRPIRMRSLTMHHVVCDNSDVTTSVTGSAAGNASGLVHIRLLALNDFHGQLTDSPSKVDGVDIGGAATMAAYINRERAADPDGTVLVSAGDAYGASVPESSLLEHKSTLAVLAAMGVDVATFGNHEWDRGFRETMRLIKGDAAVGGARDGAEATGKRRKKKQPARGSGAAAAGQAASGAKQLWPGSPFPYLSANIVDKKTGKPIAPPYEIKTIKGVKVAFVGAVTKDLKKVTLAAGIPNIEALDPATAINAYIPELKAQGVRTIVVLAHEGGEPDKQAPDGVSGPIVDLAKRLDPEVDVVVSAHSHQEYSTRIAGKIVTQAGSYAKALAEIDLAIDPKTGDVVDGSSRLLRNDEHGIAPDPTVNAMVKGFQRAVAPQTMKVVSILPGKVTREASPAGESALGTLIAEAQRTYAKADVAMMNPGGIRQDITEGGAVTWGTVFGVQPFANHLTSMKMTGAQILEALEQMFPKGSGPKILQIAGMRVSIDATRPIGHRIVAVKMDDGSRLDPKRTYTVAVNSFLADGGDGFVAFRKGTEKRDVGVDLDALVDYLRAGKPVPTKPIGRLKLVAGSLPLDAH